MDGQRGFERVASFLNGLVLFACCVHNYVPGRVFWLRYFYLAFHPCFLEASGQHLPSFFPVPAPLRSRNGADGGDQRKRMQQGNIFCQRVASLAFPFPLGADKKMMKAIPNNYVRLI